jgi:hypothetical protein
MRHDIAGEGNGFRVFRLAEKGWVDMPRVDSGSCGVSSVLPAWDSLWLLHGGVSASRLFFGDLKCS